MVSSTTNTPQEPLRDSIVDAVRDDLLRRSQFGIAKYGVSLDRKDLSLRDWLQHAYEECLDQANYLKRSIIAFDCGEGIKLTDIAALVSLAREQAERIEELQTKNNTLMNDLSRCSCSVD